MPQNRSLSAESRRIRRTLVKDTPGAQLAQTREAWESAAAGVPLPAGVEAIEESLGGVDCLWLIPDGKQLHNDVILYLHGGGLVEGSVVTAREWTARLAVACKLPVVSVNYRLAPEHPYPAALNDVQSVYQALMPWRIGRWQPLTGTRYFGARGSVLGIGADSSGCNLALQFLVALRDREQTAPGCAIFLSPSVDQGLSGESVTANEWRDPMVSAAVLEECAQMYAGSFDRHSAALSPLFAPLHQLPDFLILACTDELLFDDARRLHAGVLAAKGRAELYAREGLWHVWPYWGELPESREATDHIARFVRAYKRAD